MVVIQIFPGAAVLANYFILWAILVNSLFSNIFLKPSELEGPSPPSLSLGRRSAGPKIAAQSPFNYKSVTPCSALQTCKALLDEKIELEKKLAGAEKTISSLALVVTNR